VNISLDGRKNNFALDLLAFALHRVLYDLESRLGCFCAHEQLRQEHSALLEALADAVKRRNQLVVDDLERRNRLQHFLCCVDRTFTQAAFNALRKRHRRAACCRRSRCRLVAVGRNIACALLIQVGQRQIGTIRFHHRLVIRVDDRARQTALHRHGEEVRVDNLTLRQTERNVRYAENRVTVQLITNAAQRFKRYESRTAVRRNGHRQTVNHDILMRNTVFLRCIVNLLCNPDAALCRGRNAVFIQCQTNNNTAVLAYKREHGFHAFHLAADRIDHRLTVVQAHAALHCDGIRGVNLQRQRDNTLQARNNALHHHGFVDFRQTDVDIKDMCAAVLLRHAFTEDVLDVILAQSCLEFALAGRVDTLTDDNRLRPDLHGL